MCSFTEVQSWLATNEHLLDSEFILFITSQQLCTLDWNITVEVDGVLGILLCLTLEMAVKTAALANALVLTNYSINILIVLVVI